MKLRARAFTDALKKKHYVFVARYKVLVGCKVCGYDRYHKALEFHHTGYNIKDSAVSDMINNGVNTARLKQEIRKCLVLCANCHREAHKKSPK